VVLACAHGGNAGPLARAVGRLVAEGRPVAAWWPRWGGDLHAGATETSVMLAIAPDRVRLARAEAGDRRPAAEIQEALAAHGVAAVSANGVLGDPAGASADAGEALLEAAAADLVAAADALRSRSAPVGSR
jgi:creatinine amidohydrolase